MNLAYSAEYERFRTEVRRFLVEHWSEPGGERAASLADLTGAHVRTDARATAFRLLAIERGYLYRHVPRRYGGSEQPADPLKSAIIADEFRRVRAPYEIMGQGPSMLVPTLLEHGTETQKERFLAGLLDGSLGFAFGITEPEHGSDATHMETRARRDGNGWRIDGEKTWNTGVHTAPYDLIFARTRGHAGDGDGITAFLVPTDASGFKIEEYLWTFNMPTDHARISLTDVRVPDEAVFGGEGRGLQVVQHFFNENRIRQAASSLGAAQYCIDEAVAYAKVRKPFGKPLAANQAIQFPLVELQTQCEMLRALIHKTAWLMDVEGTFSASDKVSMCNYWANRLCCEAADRAMQVHGGLGYSRHRPFEHIYRHHRRYRITEGTEEIQMRRIAGYMFGFMKQRAPKGVTSD